MGNPTKQGPHFPQADRGTIHSQLRNKSSYPTVNDNKHIEVFRKLVIQDVRNLKSRKKEEPKYIKNVICKLTERNNVVIRPVDKGGGIVIQSKEQYHGNMLKLLDNKHTYTIYNIT